MGGTRHDERFADLGVTRSAIYEAPPQAFTIAERGHYLFDPTSPKKPPEDLIKSVDEFGVLEPIECVTDGNQIIVSKGRSRVRACLAANERREKRGDEPRTVRYVLRPKGKVTDEQLTTEIDVENVHRRHSGPLDIAERIARYSTAGTPDDRIAFLSGCKPSEVSSYARINTLAAGVRDAVRDGRVAWRVAITLDSLPRDEQVAALEGMEARGETRGSKGKQAAKEATGKGKSRSGDGSRMLPRKKLDRVWEAVEERLSDPDDNKARGKEWETFRRAIRFYASGDTGELNGLPDYLIVTVKAAMAARKPGRKANKDKE